MDAVHQFFETFLAVIRTFRFKDAVDITAIALIIYYLIKLVKETRAVQLVKGILVLIVLYGIAFVFQLTMLTAMLSKFFEFAVLVLFIVFQPEIRKVLEQLGRSNYTYKRLRKVFTESDTASDILRQKRNIAVFVDAIMQLHEKKQVHLLCLKELLCWVI